jgi:tyrosyl-DNA phosphodiesterase 2
MPTMNDIFSKAIKDSELLRKTEVPWLLDEPFAQPYNVFDRKRSSWTAKTSHAQLVNQTRITTIALYSWNIDFMLPFGEVRMKTALDHLGGLVKDLASTPSIAPVIFLQECTPEDLITISSNPWVRERFILTDLDATYWATNHYGTTVLLDASLPVTSVFRVHYSQSRMDRDAFFVDVALGPDSGRKIVRLCNTHLESLAMDPPLRPAQVRLVAQYMHAEEVHAALAAGISMPSNLLIARYTRITTSKMLSSSRMARKTVKRVILGASKPQPSLGSSLAVRAWTRSITVAPSSCSSLSASVRTSSYQKERMVVRSSNEETKL